MVTAMAQSLRMPPPGFDEYVQPFRDRIAKVAPDDPTSHDHIRRIAPGEGGNVRLRSL